MRENDPALLPATGQPTPEQVVAYLRTHPDFFSCCPDLLQDLSPPARWTGDKVVDLQHYMVSVLRDELAGLRDCAQSVIETSRVNLATQLRTHAAVLALIAAKDLKHILRIVASDIPIFLDVDVATVGVEAIEAFNGSAHELRPLEWGAVDRLLGFDQDIALFREFSDDGTLFDTHADRVKSAAFARLELGTSGGEGVLALGARHEDTFSPGQGTELLRFLAQACGLCLNRMLAAAR